MIDKLLKIRWIHIKTAILFVISVLPAAFLKTLSSELWLISERPEEAQDNGYVFYSWLKKNHPEIKAYYLISLKSKAYCTSIQPLGNAIQFGSLKHYIYYLASNMHISAHIDGTAPTSNSAPTVNRITLYIDKLRTKKMKKVFLQHGVTKDFMDWCTYKNTGVQLFICGAQPEYEYVSNYYGYPKEYVKYTGFCRFDNLHNCKVNKNQILLMPTWRIYMRYDHNISKEENREVFLSSEYYKTYQSLINNQKLIDFIAKERLTIMFCVHPEVQRYIDTFSTKSQNIVIASTKQYAVQSLLKDSAVLITDYSSVFFDFAYMRKPVLYYQFDLEKYRETQYKEGYFVYERDGFGDVVKTEDQVVETIIKYKENNFILEQKYLDEVSKFFPLYDKNNCSRVYEEIIKLVHKNSKEGT